jgi:hypothetical protein
MLTLKGAASSHNDATAASAICDPLDDGLQLDPSEEVVVMSDIIPMHVQSTLKAIQLL